MPLMYSPRSTGSGNATVPNDALIQPPQAFVDNITGLVTAPNLATIPSLSGKGITYFKGDTLAYAVQEAYSAMGGDPPVWDFSNNALDATSINSILAGLSDAIAVQPTGTLNLSGGTNAAPTGQGIVDKAALITAGWTVTTN